MARVRVGSVARANRNADGTVTLATKGKLATTPNGSGAQRKSWAAMTVPSPGPWVTKQPGRGPVSRNAYK